MSCDEIIAGKHHSQFVVDMIQGGAGTSTNMNANEVIANRALELLGYEKGQYEHCHPNNHINLSRYVRRYITHRRQTPQSRGDHR